MQNMGSYGNLYEIKIFDAGEPDEAGYMLGRFSSKAVGELYQVTGTYVISTENPDIVITFDKEYNDNANYEQDIKDAINDAYPEYDEDEDLEDEE